MGHTCVLYTLRDTEMQAINVCYDDYIGCIECFPSVYYGVVPQRLSLLVKTILITSAVICPLLCCLPPSLPSITG